MNKPLLYRAALQGAFGEWYEFSRGGIADALFVYLDGEPEPESAASVAAHFRSRPLVCLTEAWKEQIETQWISRHLAVKFGFETDAEYLVYWLPGK